MTLTAASVADRPSAEEMPDSEVPSRWDCLSGPFYGRRVWIRPQRPDDVVVARFGLDRWRNIFEDIVDDEGLRRYLGDNEAFCRAYMLYAAGDDEPFGWIMLRRHDDVMCDSVEFHGGAWRDGYRVAVAKFAAACTVIATALRMGVRVTTRCYRQNRAALRFLQSIGFSIVRRHTGKTWYYLTLSRRRFESSAMVKMLTI